MHSAFSEALERLLFERFLLEHEGGISIPSVCLEAAQDHEYFFNQAIEEDPRFFQLYESFKEKICSGELGKTAQFWLCLYLDLVEMQQFSHIAVQENNFNLRLSCWKFFLPLFFATFKTNYSRYGSYYVPGLERIDLYPGTKALF